jgi:hypothetical protein
VSWKETAEAFIDPRHNHRALKMSKTKNIRQLKKRSRALPSSPWLGYEKEGGLGGQMQGQEQGKKAHGGTKWNDPRGDC